MDRSRNAHSHLNQDARFLVRKFAPNQRNILEDQLTRIVQHIDPSASVVPCHAPFNVHLPPEIAPDFMIVDSKNPQGLSSKSAPSELHDVDEVAGILCVKTQSIVGHPRPTPDREGFIWPPSVTLNQVLPPCTVSLSNPVIPSIASYTAGATKIKPECLRQTITLLALWAHSHDFKEFNVTSLSLMLVQLVHHLAEREFTRRPAGTPGESQDASNEHGPPNDEAHVASSSTAEQPKSTRIYMQERFKGPDGQLASRTTTIPTGWKSWGTVNSPSDVGRAKPGQLLLSFFQYYANLHHLATREVIGIPSKKRDRFVSKHKHLIQDALIVADPFLLSHNHAASVNQTILRAFSDKCKASLQKLERAEPLITVFGPLEDKLDFSPSEPKLLFTPQSTPGVSWLKPRPSPSAQQSYFPNRQDTIQRVNQAIQIAFGRRYRVEVFGSSRYQVDNPSSDMDLVIIDPDRTTGFEPGSRRLPRIYNVKLVADSLRKAGFQKVFTIPKATVPIVKFRDPVTGLECDVNVNDQLGVINSELLKQYCDISPVLRPMIKAIKRWAKPLGLNNPSGQGGGGMTFNSYTLTVMTVAFLQNMGLLPNLQNGFERLPDGATSGVFWVRTREDRRFPCDIRFHQVSGLSFPVEHTLEELLPKWLNFWGNEFQYKVSMVDIKLGGIRPRPPPASRKGKQREQTSAPAGSVDPADGLVSEMGDMRLVNEDIAIVDAHDGMVDDDATSDRAQTPEEVSIFSDDSPICVVDPFIRTKNVAGNIKQRNLARFISECKRALSLLALHGELDDIAPETGADSDFEGYGKHVKPSRKKRNLRLRQEGRGRPVGPQGGQGGPLPWAEGARASSQPQRGGRAQERSEPQRAAQGAA